MRECGDCTMCCVLPHIDAPLFKPAGLWCQHCLPRKGCSIYDDRPEICRKFVCMWLQERLPERLKPNSVGAVFGDNGDVVTVWVEADTEWREGELWGLIEQCLRVAHVCVNQAGMRFFFQADNKPLPEDISNWERKEFTT